MTSVATRLASCCYRPLVSCLPGAYRTLRLLNIGRIWLSMRPRWTTSPSSAACLSSALRRSPRMNPRRMGSIFPPRVWRSSDARSHPPWDFLPSLSPPQYSGRRSSRRTASGRIAGVRRTGPSSMATASRRITAKVSQLALEMHLG